MEKGVKKSSKLVSYRRGGFNFTPAPILKPAPQQLEKSLGREVFELLLEAVSPNTLKVRRFTESLAGFARKVLTDHGIMWFADV